MMSLQIPWRWLTVPSIVFLFNPLTLQLVSAHNDNVHHPRKILKNNIEKILTLSSDQEALEFNQRFFYKPSRSEHPHTRRKPSSHRNSSHLIAQEMQATITTFWAALATIGNIQKLRALPETRVHSTFVSDHRPTDAQQEWIHSKSSLKEFTDLLELQKQLLISPPQEPPALLSDHDYSQFVYFHDQASLTTESPSWTKLLNNLGFKGIEARLHKYWQPQNPNPPDPISDSQKQAYIQQYFTSRLLPLFQATFLALALEVEDQAYQVAWDSWEQIQQWQKYEQANQAKMRLCGTWKWLIHNHQNHGDHKSMMTFAPPGQDSPTQVQPTTILIQGDTVYLKWTFPQGTQEDSLLLSNRDARLEGTFTNSLGPHGSISGQRLSPCHK